MGFVLKKIISTFLMPLPLGILFGLIGLFYLSKAHIKRARQWIGLGIVWLFIFSYTPLANLLLYPIEQQYPALHKAPDSIRYIYVLGYGHTTDKTLPITSQINAEAIVRLSEGIRLYRQLGGKAKLILSGYSGLLDPTPHALMQQRLATSLGIPKHDIITVPQAKDTQEEAESASKITQGSPLILVTSAYHMPRAIQWFKKTGLDPIPAPTYHLASLKNPNYLGFFSVDALHKNTVAFHEFLGLLWQKIKP
jgi:uncharacterized SAM-binding protein YcdF (DUF218 family)